MIADFITSLPSFLFQNIFQNIIVIDVIIVILLANEHPKRSFDSNPCWKQMFIEALLRVWQI